jgi:hypothetical protein
VPAHLLRPAAGQLIAYIQNTNSQCNLLFHFLLGHLSAWSALPHIWIEGFDLRYGGVNKALNPR